MRITAIFAMALACLTAAIPARAETSLTMTSDQFDWVGGGKSYFYTDSDATFIAFYDTTQAYLRIDVDGPSLPCCGWLLFFEAADDQPLTTGFYAGCTRWPFQSAGEPALSVSGEARGCNTLCGEFTVHELDMVGQQVNSVWISFEQHCGNPCVSPGIYGDIRINSTASPTEHATWGAIKAFYRD